MQPFRGKNVLKIQILVTIKIHEIGTDHLGLVLNLIHFTKVPIPDRLDQQKWKLTKKLHSNSLGSLLSLHERFNRELFTMKFSQGPNNHL